MATPYRICVLNQNSKTTDAAADGSKSERQERLLDRVKSTEHRTWSEYAKLLGSTVSERAVVASAPDFTDTGQLQHCLDALHMAITIDGTGGLLERLEVISRHLSLSCVQSNSAVSISSDMFSVDVFLDASGRVTDVKITHHGDATSCNELQRLLSSGDFEAFKQHLEGLMKLYGVPGDKKSKMKAFISLQSLETDLSLLAQLQSSINGVANYIHKSPLGILIPRKAGTPMKLLYFVSPYDLLDKTRKSAYLMTVEVIMENELGRSVTVCLEASTPTKLQSIPLMTIKTSDGNRLPSFPPLNQSNSTNLSACFVLLLSKPTPVSIATLSQIQSLTNVNVTGGIGKIQDLASLVTEDASQGDIMAPDELHVTLPNQNHTYLIDSSLTSMDAAVVTKIPFTHPTNVPQILGYLRQQLLFNTVLGSCVRTCANRDAEESLQFEVKVTSLTCIIVLFEHPLQDSVASVEFDLADITNLRVQVLIADFDDTSLSDHATQVFQRSMSIPLTMRAVMSRCRPSLQNQIQQVEAARIAALARCKTPPGIPSFAAHVDNAEELLPEFIAEKSDAVNVLRNPMLASLLVFNTETTASGGGPGVVTESPMLSELLRDAEPLAGRIANAAAAAAAKNRKPRKRKSTSDALPSPKIKTLASPTEWDAATKRRNPSGNSSTSESPSSNVGHSLDYAMNESHVSKLAHTIDSIIKNKTGDTDASHYAGDAAKLMSPKLTSPTKRVTLSDLLADSSQDSPFAAADIMQASPASYCPSSRHSLSDEQPFSHVFNSFDLPSDDARLDRISLSGRRSADSACSMSPVTSNTQSAMFSPPHIISHKFVDNFARPFVHNSIDNGQTSPKVLLNRRLSGDDFSKGRRRLSSDDAPKRSTSDEVSISKRIPDYETGNCSDGENCPKSDERTFVNAPRSDDNSQSNKTESGDGSPSNRDAFCAPQMPNDLSHGATSPAADDAHTSGKIERLKKRDLKHKTLSESGKRKKVKDDFKKQRKKRKAELALMNSTYVLDNAVYMSSIDEPNSPNNRQRMPKLRILKSGGSALVDNNEPGDKMNRKTSLDDRDSIFNFDVSERLDLTERNDAYVPNVKSAATVKSKNSPKYSTALKSADLQPKVVIKSPAIRLKAVNVSEYLDSGANKKLVKTEAVKSVAVIPATTTCVTMVSTSFTSSTSSASIMTSTPLTNETNVSKMAVRSRKGSLTAVIDKLTKASSGSEFVAPTQDELTAQMTAIPESDSSSVKCHSESPASASKSGVVDDTKESNAVPVVKDVVKGDAKRDKVDNSKDSSTRLDGGSKEDVIKNGDNTQKVKSTDRPVYRSKSLNSSSDVSKSPMATKTDKCTSDVIKLSQVTTSTMLTTAATSSSTSVVDSVKIMTSSKVYKSQNPLMYSKNNNVAIQPLSLSKGYKIPKCKPNVAVTSSNQSSDVTTKSMSQATKLNSKDDSLVLAFSKGSSSKEKHTKNNKYINRNDTSKSRSFSHSSAPLNSGQPKSAINSFPRKTSPNTFHERPVMQSRSNAANKPVRQTSSPILPVHAPDKKTSSPVSILDWKPNAFPINNFTPDAEKNSTSRHNKNRIKDSQDKFNENTLSDRRLSSDNVNPNSAINNSKSSTPVITKPTKSILVNKSKYDAKVLCSRTNSSPHLIDSAVKSDGFKDYNALCKSPVAFNASNKYPVTGSIGNSISLDRSSPLCSMAVNSLSAKNVEMKVTDSCYIPDITKMRRDTTTVPQRSPTVDETLPRVPVLERLQTEYSDNSARKPPGTVQQSPISVNSDSAENSAINSRNISENSGSQNSRNGNENVSVNQFKQNQSPIVNAKQIQSSMCNSPVFNQSKNSDPSLTKEGTDNSHILNVKTNAASGKNSPRHREEQPTQNGNGILKSCLKSNSFMKIPKGRDVADQSDQAPSSPAAEISDIASPVAEVMLNGDIASPPSVVENDSGVVCPKVIPVPADCLQSDDENSWRNSAVKPPATVSSVGEPCLSPISAASSPDNLVIDVPTTPVSQPRDMSPLAIYKKTASATRTSSSTVSSPESLVIDRPVTPKVNQPSPFASYTPNKLLIDLPTTPKSAASSDKASVDVTNSLAAPLNLNDSRTVKNRASGYHKNNVDGDVISNALLAEGKICGGDEVLPFPATSPASSSPCMLDDDLMHEALGFSS